MGGSCEPVLEGGEIGVEAVAGVSIKAVFEVLNGLFLTAFLSDKIEA